MKDFLDKLEEGLRFRRISQWLSPSATEETARLVDMSHRVYCQSIRNGVCGCGLLAVLAKEAT